MDLRKRSGELRADDISIRLAKEEIKSLRTSTRKHYPAKKAMGDKPDQADDDVDKEIQATERLLRRYL